MCAHHDNPIDTRTRLTREYTARYPGIAKAHPEMIRQFVESDMRGVPSEKPGYQTHPEVWMNARALSVFLDRGAVRIA